MSQKKLKLSTSKDENDPESQMGVSLHLKKVRYSCLYFGASLAHNKHSRTPVIPTVI